ncbi:MAG TPA: lysine-sensitive aspartokinase 3 [Bacteroidota bacterium]|nr:lysine-sensitive aspartokinase 3 [Bacteroidota bacterium]
MDVMKFGGTSVEDATAFRNVCDIISERKDPYPLIVVSAPAGVTNTLLRLADSAGAGTIEPTLEEVEKLRTRLTSIAAGLLKSNSASAIREISRDVDDLSHLLRSVAVIQEVTPRLLDQCAAYGEFWSSQLLVYALRERNIPAEFCDARKIMVTSDAFTKAEPQFEAIEARVRDLVQPALKRGVAVMQGFVGATAKGVTTTLGRGGSDYSAAILGSALGAKEIQIWTDVDGILSADPGLIREARLLGEVTFDEAAELAYFGAKVLHPSTILPAMKKNIPVRVLNSKRPGVAGTLITARPGSGSESLVKSIAFKKNITVVTIQSTRMLMAYGFLSRVFEIFKQYKKSIDVVATSEVGVSLTVDDPSNLEMLVGELREFSDVKIERNKSVVSVVGEKMKHTTGIAGKVFRALGDAGVNVELISHGGSEINLTFVISESQTDKAVRALHAELFPPSERKP